MKAGTSLGGSDYDMVEFRILRKGNKANAGSQSRLKARHFGIFRHQPGRIPWDTALERRVQELGDSSRVTFSKLKTRQSPHAENEAKGRGAPDKTQTQKGSTSELEAGTSELGRIQRHCLRCKNGVKKAKAHLELNLARDGKGSMKGFYMSTSSRR